MVEVSRGGDALLGLVCETFSFGESTPRPLSSAAILYCPHELGNPLKRTVSYRPTISVTLTVSRRQYTRAKLTHSSLQLSL